MKKIYALMMFGFCMFLLPSFASAEIQDLEVRMNFNSNQVEGFTKHFNMNVEGGETLSASFTMTNHSSEPMTVTIKQTNALTGCYGNINYTTETEVPNAWIDEDVAIADNITIENEVVIPAESTVEVPFTVSVPEDGTGTLLGGFRIYVEGSENTTDAGNVSITTNADQVYGLQLNYPTSEEQVVSNDYVMIEGNTLYVHIENENNTITEDVQATVTLEDSDGNLIFGYDIQPFKMAPSSEIEYPVAYDGTLENGTYYVTVSLNGEETVCEVEVTNDGNVVVGETIEKPSVESTSDDTRFLLWILIVITTAGAITYCVRKKKQAAVAENKNNNNTGEKRMS